MSAVEQLYRRPDPRRRRPVASPTEDEIHRAVVAHLRTRPASGLIWWHTPNDGKRSHATAARLKAMGMRAGVPDIVLIRCGSVYALELKSATGRPTVPQMQFMSEFNAAGGNGCICHDIDRALRCLERWGLLR